MGAMMSDRDRLVVVEQRLLALEGVVGDMGVGVSWRCAKAKLGLGNLEQVRVVCETNGIEGWKSWGIPLGRFPDLHRWVGENLWIHDLRASSKRSGRGRGDAVAGIRCDHRGQVSGPKNQSGSGNPASAASPCGGGLLPGEPAGGELGTRPQAVGGEV